MNTPDKEPLNKCLEGELQRASSADRASASKKHRRIAIAYNTSWYLFHFRRPLIEKLIQEGYDVYALSPVDGSETRLIGIGCHHVPIAISQHGTNPLQEIKTITSLATALKNINPNVVISYTIKCNIYCGLICKILGYKQIANIVGLGRAFEQGSRLRILAQLLYRLSIGSAAKVFFQNTEDREAFTIRGILREEQTEVTPGSGVDLLSIQFATPRTSNLTTTFFIFGRLIPEKGFDLFLEAARRINESRPTQARFLIAGALDGTQVKSLALKQRIEQAAQEGVVEFLGHREDIPQLLTQSDVVVLPSTYNEGVPRSLLEALASGKPLITTDWKGCRDTINQNRNGRLIKPHDMASLQQAMEELIDMSHDQRSEMAKESRLFAEAKFDQEFVLQAYLKAIDYLSRLQ